MLNPLIQRAQLLLSQHRYDMAADACREALGQSPQDSFAHALLALCLVQQEKYEEATAEAQAAVHLAPDEPFPQYVLGTVYQSRNRFAEAEAAAREAVRLAPDDADYWALLANSLLARERWPESLEAANTGLQFDPEHVLCTNLRAMALVKLGDKQAAARSMGQALQRDPHNALSHANQGWTMLHQNNHRQALEHFRESLRLDPNDEWAREGMIAALKARHLPYRVILRYYLWMNRIGQRGQWAFILGLWIGMQVLRGVKDSYPGLAPVIYPVMAAYVLFVLSGWLADPLFNFTLLISSYGRYLLSRPQRVGAVVVGALLVGGMVSVPAGFLVELPVWFMAGLVMLLLTLPSAAAFRCRERNRLMMMSLYLGVLTLAGVAAVVLTAQGDDRAYDYLAIVAWGSVLSSLVSNILGSMVQTK